MASRLKADEKKVSDMFGIEFDTPRHFKPVAQPKSSPVMWVIGLLVAWLAGFSCGLKVMH